MSVSSVSSVAGGAHGWMGWDGMVHSDLPETHSRVTTLVNERLSRCETIESSDDVVQRENAMLKPGAVCPCSKMIFNKESVAAG